MSKKTIFKIATGFSEFPAGRYPKDGPHNGETFRTEVLVPLLESHETVIVDLDGTDGYGSSFLEEAFCGLVRRHGFTSVAIQKQFKLITEEDEKMIDEKWGYVKDGHSDYNIFQLSDSI